MSIATQIERLQNAKESLKAKLIAKGVEVSDDAKLDQYADFVDEIKTEGAPTGQLEITANGNYNVINYAKANVNVPIPDGYIQPSGSLDVTENGDYDVTTKESVSVNVKPKLYHTSITPTKQQQEATPIASYDGFNKVTVNAIPERFIVPSGVKSITENGNTDVKNYASALVNVLPKLQEKEVTKNGEVLPDSGYDGLSKVTVNVASSGGGESTLKKLLDATKSCYHLFYQYTGSSVDALIEYNDTENVTKFEAMFEMCSNVINFPLINTSKGTSMKNMFNHCSKAETLPNIDMSNNTSLSGTFCYCSNLKYLPKFNTAKVTNYNSTFRSCSHLQTIDLSLMSAYDTAQMCAYCYSLKAFIIRSLNSVPTLSNTAFQNCYHILGTTNSTYNPNGDKDGYIYVPRDMVNTLKSATNWSSYADQIRALEDYTVDGTTTGDLDMDKVNAPSGYNVNLDPDAYVTSGKIYYSFDNGSVWLDLYPIKDRENPILTGVTQIKFKAKSTMLYCEELGMALEPMMGEEESENYTLSQDITLSTM